MGLAHVRALILITLLPAFAAEAHEIGTTRVNARFGRDHTYRIDVATSAVSLQRRHATSRMILDFVEIRFGAERVVPRLTMLPGPVIRLEGDIPPHVTTFAWRYRLTFASYAMTAVNDGDSPDQRRRREQTVSALACGHHAHACRHHSLTQITPFAIAHSITLHGMGFAGVLRELGLPRAQFLLFFGWWAMRRPAYRRRFLIPASAAIAATGVFWTIQRGLF